MPIEMPNFIPPVSDNDSSPPEEDTMSPKLRAQFEALQRLHSERQQSMTTCMHANDNTNDNDSDNDSHLSRTRTILSTGSMDDSDDDECFSVHAHAHDATAPIAVRMAISAAITAQNEIDALMNGIAELEDMVNANETSNACSDSRGSSAVHRSSVEEKDKNACVTVMDMDFDV